MTAEEKTAGVKLNFGMKSIYKGSVYGKRHSHSTKATMGSLLLLLAVLARLGLGDCYPSPITAEERCNGYGDNLLDTCPSGFYCNAWEDGTCEKCDFCHLGQVLGQEMILKCYCQGGRDGGSPSSYNLCVSSPTAEDGEDWPIVYNDTDLEGWGLGHLKERFAFEDIECPPWDRRVVLRTRRGSNMEPCYTM